jgi:hypothetical protein
MDGKPAKQADAFFVSKGEPAEIWHGDSRTLPSLLKECRNFEI